MAVAVVDAVRTDHPDHGVLATMTPLPAYMIHSYQEYVGVQISVAVMLATINPWLMEYACEGRFGADIRPLCSCRGQQGS